MAVTGRDQADFNPNPILNEVRSQRDLKLKKKSKQHRRNLKMASSTPDYIAVTEAKSS